MTGRVRSEEERTGVLPMKWSCMPPLCRSGPAAPCGVLRGHGLADRHELVAVLAQPEHRRAGVLLVRMEVAAEVLAPGAVGERDQAALAEQVSEAAFPGA